MFLGLSKDALGRLVARFKDRDVALQEDPIILPTGTLTNQVSPVLGTVYDISSLASSALPAGLYEVELKVLFNLTWTSGASSAGRPQLILRDGSNNVLDTVDGPATGDDAANFYAPRSIHHHATLTWRGRLAAGTSLKGSMSVVTLSGTPVFSSLAARGDIISSRLTIRRIGA